MKKYPVIFALFIISNVLYPQNSSVDTARIKIELKDGSTLIGTIQVEDSVAVHFITGSGVTMTIPHHLIRFKFPISESAAFPAVKDTSKKTVYAVDPNRTRLFLMPTARPIGSGQGYFSAYELFFPTIALGIGSSVSVAGGMSLIPGSSSQLLYFAPKVTVLNSKSVSLAVGGLFLGAGGDDDGTSVLYAAGTFGNERASLTFTARIPTEPDQNSLFVIGGEVQTSESFKLISENWIFDDYILYGFGFRFFSGKLAADLGFFRSSTQSDGNGFPFFPWLGFAYNFGTPPAPAQEDYNAHDEFAHVSLRSRISYSFFLFGSDEEIKQSLRDQGYYTDSYSGGLFSSGSNNSTGSGILIQIEYPVRNTLFGGFTYSSIGNIIGSKPKFVATKYDYQGSFYSNVSLTSERSVDTYAAHLAYSTVNNNSDHNDQTFTAGAGIGVSTYAISWDYQSYYTNVFRGLNEQDGSALTALLFLSLEQRIAQNISIGIDASYFFMRDVDLGGFQLYSGTHLDTSVFPNIQRTVIANLDRHSVNFSYGKIGVCLGVNL
ncbi:MAG: hypothetical protein KA247_03220 [Bacteroidetes bacterium]|nr:hypothetical protein [Bacteroidota bacterium]